MSGIEITQADREALARFIREDAPLGMKMMFGGDPAYKLAQAFARHRHEASAEADLYKRALMDIGAALLAGRVCDDVAWFDKHETLFDFVQSALEPDHTEPAPDMLGNFPISRDERRIIEWLEKMSQNYGRGIGKDVIDLCAKRIERGEHRK